MKEVLAKISEIKLKHVLNHLISEMSEVTKVVTKIFTYGLTSVNPKSKDTNLKELNDEIADVLGLLQILFELGISKHIINPSPDVLDSYKKKLTVIEESIKDDDSYKRILRSALSNLETAARYVAIKDNSNSNPEAVDLRKALEQASKALELRKAEPEILFEDPRVKMVYELLCSDERPLNREEHWEGFIARRIVETLNASKPNQ